LRLLVNNRLVPLVIGKGGSTVNDLQSRTQSRIVVSSPNNSLYAPAMWSSLIITHAMFMLQARLS
jgi:hypothetical protein